MRFCLSCKHSLAEREQADELIVDYKDIEFINEYLETSNQTQFITLRIPKDTTNINWEYFLVYKEKLNNQFMIEIEDLSMIKSAKQYDIDFCWSYPATNYYELTQLKNLGAKEIIISGQLIFDQNYLINSGFTNLRLVPNYAFNIFPEDTGVCGSWIRPEALSSWNLVAASCFFQSKNLLQEKTLFDIYKEGTWNNDLSLIIEGLKIPMYGQYLGTSINAKRANCQQICMKDNRECNFCNRIKNLSYIVKDAAMTKTTEDN